MSDFAIVMSVGFVCLTVILIVQLIMKHNDGSDR
jgi:hypothetical protein